MTRLFLKKLLAQSSSFFDAALDLAADDELENSERVEKLQVLLSEDIYGSALNAMFTDSATLRDLQSRINASLTEVFEQGIKENEEELARRRLNQEVALYPFSADLKRVTEVLIKPLITQNMHYNAELTEQNRELARSQVEPVVILRNTLIVSEGEPVTEQQLAQLQELGLIRGQQADYPAYIGLFMLLVIVFIIVGVYMSIFVNNVYNSPACFY
jgi:cyclic-di-AMP phosphodiesterase PgpH